MQNQKSSIVFDQERASSYDERFTKVAPLRDALHLLIHLVLSELPADARILCVGVGTGSELIHLDYRLKLHTIDLKSRILTAYKIIKHLQKMLCKCLTI
jgi:hypothetical protein